MRDISFVRGPLKSECLTTKLFSCLRKPYQSVGKSRKRRLEEKKRCGRGIDSGKNLSDNVNTMFFSKLDKSSFINQRQQVELPISTEVSVWFFRKKKKKKKESSNLWNDFYVTSKSNKAKSFIKWWWHAMENHFFNFSSTTTMITPSTDCHLPTRISSLELENFSAHFESEF